MKLNIKTINGRLKVIGIKRIDLAKKMKISRQRLSRMLIHTRSFNVVERLSRELDIDERSLVDFDE